MEENVKLVEVSEMTKVGQRVAWGNMRSLLMAYPVTRDAISESQWPTSVREKLPQRKFKTTEEVVEN